MYKIEIRNNEASQNALRLLRTALGFDALSEMDASGLILLTKTRINRLTEGLNESQEDKKIRSPLVDQKLFIGETNRKSSKSTIYP